MMDESFLKIHDRSKSQYYDIPYLFGGLIPQTGWGILFGETGTGKTLASIYIASCLATGSCIGQSEEALHELPVDFAIPENLGSTIYITGEGKSGITARLNGAEESIPEPTKNLLPAAFRGQLPIITLTNQKPLQQAEQINELIEKVHSYRQYYGMYGFPIRLIVFDTMTSLFDIHNENDNSEIQRKIVNSMVEFSEAFQCFVLLVAHPSKSKRAMSGYTRGATSLVNGADVILELKGKKSLKRTMTVIKIRDGACEGVQLNFKLISNDCGPSLIPYQAEDIKKENPAIKPSISRLTQNDEMVLKIIQNESTSIRKKFILDKLKTKDISRKESNTLSKRISRSLDKLLELEEIIKQTENGVGYYSVAKINEIPAVTVTENSDLEKTT